MSLDGLGLMVEPAPVEEPEFIVESVVVPEVVPEVDPVVPEVAPLVLLLGSVVPEVVPVVPDAVPLVVLSEVVPAVPGAEFAVLPAVPELPLSIGVVPVDGLPVLPLDVPVPVPWAMARPAAIAIAAAAATAPVLNLFMRLTPVVDGGQSGRPDWVDLFGNRHAHAPSRGRHATCPGPPTRTDADPSLEPPSTMANPRASAVRGASPSARHAVVDRLRADHERILRAFREFDHVDSLQACQQIVQRTCAELKVHAAIEEELFYPAVRRAIDEPDLVDEAEIEHGSVAALVEAIELLSPDDIKYKASFRVLGDYVQHHVRDEETELFPQLVQAAVDWDALAGAMAQRRVELCDEFGLLCDESDEEAVRAAEAGASR